MGRSDQARQRETRVERGHSSMTLPIERGLAKTFAGHIHWRACGSGPVVMVSHINQQSSALMVELLQALAPALPRRRHRLSQPRSLRSYRLAAAHRGLRACRHRNDGLARASSAPSPWARPWGPPISIALGAGWPQRIDKARAGQHALFHRRRHGQRDDIADIAKVRPSDATGFPAPRTHRVPAARTIPSMRRCSRRSPGWIASTPPSSRSAATAGRRCRRAGEVRHARRDGGAAAVRR